MSTDTARMAEAVLDDEMTERMRALVGTDLRIDHSVNNEVATRLAVDRFADAIGDPNPLWRDRALAEASPYARAVAPPSFVMGCFSGLQFGWPGLGSFHSSSSLRFHHPVFVGDTITATCRYDGFDGPTSSSFASTMVTDHFHDEYRDQDDRLLAEIDWRVMNFMRQQAKAGTTQHGLELPRRWTDDEVATIEREVLAEARWWDDVAVGDRLDVVTKGPIGMTDEVAYVAAGGPPIPRVAANGVSLRQYQRHPAWAFRDPVTMALEPIYAVCTTTSRRPGRWASPCSTASGSSASAGTSTSYPLDGRRRLDPHRRCAVPQVRVPRRRRADGRRDRAALRGRRRRGVRRRAHVGAQPAR